MNNPTPEAIKAAREAAKLTQTQAAKLIYSNISAWQQWEYGANKMHPAFFELFQIKTKEIVKKLAKEAKYRKELQVSRH